MLQEIMLSLSGRPSSLLLSMRQQAQLQAAGANDHGGRHLISPSERALLGDLAHLSDLQTRITDSAARVATTNPSTVCRAVAGAVQDVLLSAFSRKVLDVEAQMLRGDAGLVGSYSLVPLTAVAAEFAEWTRRLEWLWDVLCFVDKTHGRQAGCPGAALMDRLRAELSTGYVDVAETATILVRIAEVAWVKQVSAWILYGRLPSFGECDFFIQRIERRCEDGQADSEDFFCDKSFLPAFVTPATASSMFFIGRSLNQIRARSAAGSGHQHIGHLSPQLNKLSTLTYPLAPAVFSRTVAEIRQFLSKTLLQKFFPLSKALETLQLLRDFFLLGRGEFAMALTQQADDTIRKRWKWADNPVYEKTQGLGTVVVKEGEVYAALEKAWAAMESMQGQHAEEDEGLELARDMIRLKPVTSKASRPATPAAIDNGLRSIVDTPFQNLLFSVPVIMTLPIQSPLDLFLAPSDLQTYSSINAYLLAIRRAHIRLTDLWKIAALRRQYPSLPSVGRRGGRELGSLMRERFVSRADALRGAWATASAAVFFFAETEAYLQNEVVDGLWGGLHQWIRTGKTDSNRLSSSVAAAGKRITLRFSDARAAEDSGKKPTKKPEPTGEDDQHGKDRDTWPTYSSESDQAASTLLTQRPDSLPHDPQTLASAHRACLRALCDGLLLTSPSFTAALFDLLESTDRLVEGIHRLHALWSAADLDSDAGVVDAFVDLDRDEAVSQADLQAAEARVKKCVREAVEALREGVDDPRMRMGMWTEMGQSGQQDDGPVDMAGGTGESVMGEFVVDRGYVPGRFGGVDRLLMKLDFGGWF